MGYLQEVDRWLDDVLAHVTAENRAQVKREIKNKILESYRNGQGARPESPEPRRSDTRGDAKRRPFPRPDSKR